MVGNFAWNARRSLFVPPVEIVNIERENKTRLDTVFPFHWKSQLSDCSPLTKNLISRSIGIVSNAQTFRTSIERKRAIRNGTIAIKIRIIFEIKKEKNGERSTQSSLQQRLRSESFPSTRRSRSRPSFNLEQIAFQSEREEVVKE